MKIIIETPTEGAEDEIIIRCHELDEEVMSLIYALKQGRTRITAYSGKTILQLSPKDIYYFESVDNKVFAYCEKEVYEVKEKLYEIESIYSKTDFQRISKSVIVNISRIESVSPTLGARLEANLQNGERVIISRQYVPDLKKKLGIAER
ncbi:MAG: LytTR family transcriptional regulator DNA-binding domain-containing protein [Oscillospiraceae bacterium]|nr:LytTR family transcriptional regulator DNA-binding domain-containing protein [Oscillospiraceae bacterium]